MRDHTTDPVRRRATSKEEQSRSFVIIRVYGRWTEGQNGPTGFQPPMTDEPHVISRFPRQPPPGVQLDSWKQIAGYLKRHVTTVRRWERHEGLPVHRHFHSKLGSI